MLADARSNPAAVRCIIMTDLKQNNIFSNFLNRYYIFCSHKSFAERETNAKQTQQFSRKRISWLTLWLEISNFREDFEHTYISTRYISCSLRRRNTIKEDAFQCIKGNTSFLELKFLSYSHWVEMYTYDFELENAI